MTTPPATAHTPGSEHLGRAFEPERDFPAMVDLISEVNAAERVDWFPTPASLAIEWQPEPRFDPARDVRVVEEHGRMVAAIQVGWRERAGKVTHDIEIWVRPDARHRGLGRTLVSWAEARAREAVAEGSGGPRTSPHFLGARVDEANARARAFAEAAGYAVVRYGFVMRRPLDQPIADAPLPPGIEVRPVAPSQLRAIWVADSEAFRDHFEAAVRDESDFERFVGHPDVDPSLWQVAWDGSDVVGSVINGIYRDENAKMGLEIGWLDHVSVRRPWRGRGVAAALIARSLALLRDRGMTVAALGVDAENPTGALGVYERSGFTPYQTWIRYRKPL